MLPKWHIIAEAWPVLMSALRSSTLRLRTASMKFSKWLTRLDRDRHLLELLPGVLPLGIELAALDRPLGHVEFVVNLLEEGGVGVGLTLVKTADLEDDQTCRRSRRRPIACSASGPGP